MQASFLLWGSLAAAGIGLGAGLGGGGALDSGGGGDALDVSGVDPAEHIGGAARGGNQVVGVRPGVQQGHCFLTGTIQQKPHNYLVNFQAVC